MPNRHGFGGVVAVWAFTLVVKNSAAAINAAAINFDGVFICCVFSKQLINCINTTLTNTLPMGGFLRNPDGQIGQVFVFFYGDGRFSG
jgi:hypothetical protein